MTSCKYRNTKAATILWPVLLCAVMVSACGGGGGSSQSAGVGGTGVSTARGYVQGKITGFGSIYVNGDKFNVSSSKFIVDGDDSLGQDDLAVGMIVTLEVETSKGQYTGKAFKVIYDDEVQGPVAATPVDVPGSGGAQKTFKIFGQTVTIDATQTVFKGTSFAGLDANDVVEISGFRISPSEISASYVEWKDTLQDGSEVELRGKIMGYSPPAKQFTIDAFPITFDTSTDIEGGAGGLANGLYVEVKGEYQTAGPSVSATKIEREDEGFGDDVDDISLQGPISAYNGIADFKINGQRVDASLASPSPATALALLADGVEVEVEGNIVGGVLLADELQVEEVEVKLSAFVFSVDALNNQFEVEFTGLAGTILVNTNGETEFDDEGLPISSVADLLAGDFVAVEGIESAAAVTAGVVKRMDNADPDDSELEGRVEAFSAPPTPSVTVLGIAFPTNSGTSFEDGSGKNISETKFYSRVKPGDRVEIRDEVTADGSAEKVKLDD